MVSSYNNFSWQVEGQAAYILNERIYGSKLKLSSKSNKSVLPYLEF